MRSKTIDEQRADALARVQGGEWLGTTGVAFVLRVSRKTVDRMMADGRLGWAYRPSGATRLIDPVDVLQRLDDATTVHHGPLRAPGRREIAGAA